MFLFRSDTLSRAALNCAPLVLIKGGFRMAFDCFSYTPMILTINVRPERDQDLVEPECITVFPDVPRTVYLDGFGNRCTRLTAPPGRISIWNSFVIADSGIPEELPHYALQHPVTDLPEETLVYLVGSRYCDTQKLSSLAWSRFGGYSEGWCRVEAIMNYTHERLQFSYPNARNDRTAFEAHEERSGVCRDFAHLAITLFRCMNIPARYCTGYLGDIGVPLDPAPMDFSAWMEVYLGGQWWTLDARHNRPRIGRILMARGRDAADTAISTAFGTAELAEFSVITEV
jgi:transglutaminase-like putative cysteine protease